MDDMGKKLYDKVQIVSYFENGFTMRDVPNELTDELKCTCVPDWKRKDISLDVVKIAKRDCPVHGQKKECPCNPHSIFPSPNCPIHGWIKPSLKIEKLKPLIIYSLNGFLTTTNEKTLTELKDKINEIIERLNGRDNNIDYLTGTIIAHGSKEWMTKIKTWLEEMDKK